jgi:hypothetical protein
LLPWPAGEEGADALAGALRCNTSLCKLGLSKNRLDDGALRACAAALRGGGKAGGGSPSGARSSFDGSGVEGSPPGSSGGGTGFSLSSLMPAKLLRRKW